MMLFIKNLKVIKIKIKMKVIKSNKIINNIVNNIYLFTLHTYN